MLAAFEQYKILLEKLIKCVHFLQLFHLVFPAEKEIQVRSDDFGRDLSSVMTLLTKQETFDAGLTAFDKEGIQAITALKDQLVAAEHEQTEAILKRYGDVKAR